MFIKCILFSLVLATCVCGQQSFGDEIILDNATSSSVQNSVQSLGNEVLKSNYKYAIDKMYPRWKKRQALRIGSELKLLEQYNNVGVKLFEAGVTLNKFAANPPLKAFRVHPKVSSARNRNRVKSTLNFEVLVFVPTKTEMTIILANEPNMKIERTSFQIAISKENQNEWTFIDGATISVNDLRSLFPTLPNSLKFPKKSDVEIN